MGTYTKNYKMYKPAKTDYYNIEKDQNANFDILDTELKKTNDSNKDLFEMIQGNSGIKFDKNLIFLNDAGEKKKGNVYLDKLQNGMFECIQTTTSTVNNSSYFRNFSNNELSNRIDNLISYKNFKIGQLGKEIEGYSTVIGHLCLMILFVGGDYEIDEIISIKLPYSFPEGGFFTVVDNDKYLGNESYTNLNLNWLSKDEISYKGVIKGHTIFIAGYIN